MSNISLGVETESLLRQRFEKINRLTNEQSARGQFGYINNKINNDWHTFYSGAISMLKIQQELVNK